MTNAKPHCVLVATIAILNAFPAFAQSSDSAKDSTNKEQGDELFVNGFRSPSIGLEWRHNSFSLHGGYYTTILNRGGEDKNRSTQFLKLGSTYYFGQKGSREMFVSPGFVYGLSDGWKRGGGFLEFGTRWKVAPRWDIRLGSGLLLVSGKPARLNPTPGISYSIPLR